MQRLHEQPEPAKRPQAEPDPPAPRAVEAVLRLQRSAGNAAVGRMLQRKIGFELEAGHWRTAFLGPPHVGA